MRTNDRKHGKMLEKTMPMVSGSCRFEVPLDNRYRRWVKENWMGGIEVRNT